MKIAFINPKGKQVVNEKMKLFWEETSSQFLRHSLSGCSSALLVLAALTSKSHKIALIDENFEKIDFDKKYDLVAISMMTQQACRAYEIADVFRSKGNKVVMGGIHATVLPDEAKKHADSVAIGEAEDIWNNIIEDAKNNSLKSFYVSERSVDLTKNPVPRYDLLKKEHYNIIWIQTTRGCPRDCEFCAASKIFGLKLRHKTIKQVVREVKFIISLGKKFQISFADDNMLIDKKYAKSLLKALGPLNIRWFGQTDISIAEDDNFLKLLRDSGCAILFIGFESLTKNSLKFVDGNSFKLKRLDKYSYYVNKIQSLGIGVLGSFVLGLDGDDLSAFNRTSDFIIKNHLYASQLTVLTPLPGTRLRERLEKENRLFAHDRWERYTFWDVNFIPKNMNPQELERGLLEVHRRIYSKKVLSGVAKYFKDVYAREKRSSIL